jgi:hypothetical protein
LTVTLTPSGVSHDHNRSSTTQEASPLSRTRTTLPVALLAVAGLLLLAGSASAKDRNHDRIPDRWEKRHHLSLHHGQARKDQDHDGLRNRAEFKAGDNPRDADTDGDGIDDGAENAGTIVSFDGTTLKISVFGQSDPMVGQVTDATEIECESSAAQASSDDPSGESEPGDDHGDDPSGDDHGDDQGDDNDDQGEDHDRFDEQPCGTDQLTAGMKVKEAELHLEGGNAVFEKLELHP